MISQIKKRFKRYQQERAERMPSRLELIGTKKDVESLLENVSLLMDAGVTISDALRVTVDGIKIKALKKVLAKAVEEIDAGIPVHRAFAETKLFSPYVVSFVKMGEESGNLNENLMAIVQRQRKDELFISRVRSAMLYPGVVLSVTAIVGVGIVWFSLPRLAQVFSQLRTELPLLTRVMVRIGELLNDYGLYIFSALIVVVGLLLYLLFFSTRGSRIGQAILLRTPAVGGLLKEIELSRFGFTLSNLLSVGLSTPEALRSLANSTSIHAFRKFYLRLQQEADEGKTFEASFKSDPRASWFFPPTVQQIVIAGERSGSLAKSVERVGEAYELRTETSSKNLAVILEPILLVLVWLGVLAVALSVVAPIYQLVGGIDRYSGTTNVDTTQDQSPTLSELNDDYSEELLSPIPDGAITMGTVTISQGEAESVSVYSEPNGGAVGANVYEGEQFDYSAVQGDWYFIHITSRFGGWVFADYVTISEGI